VVNSGDKLNGFERGGVLLEMAIISPILVTMFLFLVDFTIHSKSQTFVTQVTRDAAIYLATVRDFPTPGENISVIGSSDFQDNSQLCWNSPPGDEINPSMCPHFNAQIRALRMIQSEAGYLNQNSLNMSSSFNGQDITFTIRIIPNANFFWGEKEIITSATLRKVNL